MKLTHNLIYGIVLLIIITIVNLYAQDPFIIKDPYPGDKYTTNGVAWGDWNNDGYDDVFLGNGAQGYKFEDFLYQNNGDGTFTKITGQAIVSEIHLSGGATWGDYDNDGDLDLYVTLTEDSFQGQDKKNLLYINNNDGTFSKSTTAGAPITDGDYSNTAGWLDYDNDGDLDLFTKNGWQGAKDEHRLYSNDGDGTFTTINAGDMTGSVGASFIAGFAPVDYDLDGDLDIFTCSGVGDNNHLWRNDGGGTFTDVGSFDAASTNGASWADFDNDGDFDLFLANYGDGAPEVNNLYENNGDGTFTKRTDLTIASETSWSLGSAWGDIDNDGDLDLFVANDYEYDTNPNFLYINDGDGTFTKNTTSVAVTDETSQAPHGVAFSDYDNDGFLDMFAAVHGPNFFLENQEPENGNTNSWLQLKLTGTTSNPTAIGAIVKVTATISGSSKTQMRLISSQTGMASHNSLRAHFGLGDATIVSEVRIEWPSGTIQILNDVNINQILEVTEGGSSESISLTSPNGGENWTVGSVEEITWSSSGTSGTVDLAYSTNNGSSWTTIESGTTDDGSYDWTIPDDPSTECLVRVSDTDGDPSDDSNATFTISAAGTMTVTAPNGGEDWQVGSLQNITWTSTNTSGDVKIEYSTNSGSSWTDVIASTTDDGVYEWTIPDDVSTTCLVRVSDTDGDPSDESDAVFTISAVPVITVTSPNGGEDWQVGSAQTITWTSTNTSGTVKLEYSTNNGGAWTEIDAGTGDDGSYDWTIPDAPSTQCLVRVTDTDGSPSDESDAVFTISAVPVITVTSPNGGEDWQVGSAQTITWTSTNTSGTVKLEYSTNNGGAWTEIVAGTDDDGTHDWTIPDAPSTQCLVKVTDTDGSPSDQSDAVFTISAVPEITVTAPNGGETWTVGTTETITWTSVNAGANVKIEYSTDNGGAWTEVVASTANDGTYDWIIPDTPSTQCLVKITDTTGSPADQSDAVFTITAVPAITVTAPNGGESWTVATSQEITWTSVNTSGNVKLEYSTDNGGAWIEIVASTADDGLYDWTIPDAPSNECLVKITDTDGSPSDQSDAVFTISAVPVITVTSPNGGESWAATTTETITWTSVNTSGTVKLEYSTDNGGAWTEIVASTTDDGSYDWTVPIDPSTECLVRVSDTDGDPVDQSDAVFTITAEAGDPVTDLTASVVGDDILLEWSALVDVTTYNVYRGTSYDFNPDFAGGSNRIATDITDEDSGAEGVQWTDTGNGADVVGDLDTHYFYRVTGSSGVETEESNLAGEFDIQLETTTGTDINELVVIMNTQAGRSPILTAEDLAQAIPNCTDVYRWDTAGQGQVGHPKGTPIEDFDILPGYPYIVNVTANTVWTVAGSYEMATFDLITTSGTDINHIGVPFEKSDLTTAEQLGSDIPNCTDVYYWDVPGQGQVGHPVGTPVEDFAVKAAFPYYVNVTSASTWPSETSSAPESSSGTLAKSQRTESSAIGSNIPHTVFGQFSSSGEYTGLTLTAWISGRDHEVLTDQSIGAGLDESYWWIPVGNFPSSWSKGEIVNVEIRDGDNNLVGRAQVELTHAGSDQASDIVLGVVSDIADHSAAPDQYKLYSNYPNPFNPTTTIAFDLPADGDVLLEIFDVRGVRVKTILNEHLQAGHYEQQWDGTDFTGNVMSSGLYFFKLTANQFTETHKMIFAK